MHIITRKRLNDFAERQPEARSALAHWYREMKRRRVYIRAVLTHQEYGEGKWKE